MKTSTGRVVQPGEGESFWQPVPANGFVEVAIARSSEQQEGFSACDVGIQEIAPGARVRRHAHSSNEELILVLAGRGTAIVAETSHIMQPGTVLQLTAGIPHEFLNDDPDAPLRFYFILSPGGLRDFFEAIGRPRRPGEPVPAPFPRPDDVAEIERRTVFATDVAP